MERSGISAIMVPLDGSREAVRAAGIAARMARLRNASLHLTGVFQPILPAESPPDTTSEPDAFFREDFRAHLQRVALDVADFYHLAPETTLLEGTGAVARQLEEWARANGIDLVVMRTRARGGIERLLLGSVADELINDTDLPCLLLRDHHTGGASEPQLHGIFHRILVPLDASVASRAGIDQALAVATPGITELRLLLVIPTLSLPMRAGESLGSPGRRAELDEYFAELVAEIESRDVRARFITISHPSAAGGILERVHSQAIDLISIVSEHRSAANRFFLGSVIDQLVTGSTVPILARRKGRAAVSDRRRPSAASARHYRPLPS